MLNSLEMYFEVWCEGVWEFYVLWKGIEYKVLYLNVVRRNDVIEIEVVII